MTAAVQDTTWLQEAAAPSPVALSRESERPMLGLATTYVLAFLFLFFATGAQLPSTAGRTSSLAGQISETTTVLGQCYQATVWAIALYLVLRSWKITLAICLRMRSMLLLSLLAPLSALWSQQPALSLRRGVFLVFGTVLASFLVARFAPKDIAQSLMLAGLLGGMLSILAALLLPGMGVDPSNGQAWQGIFGSKNGCGQLMLFFLSPALAFRFRTTTANVLRYALLPLAVLIIVLSNAKTAWILSVFYPAFVALLGWSRRLRRHEALLTLVGAVFALGVFLAFLPYVLPYVLQMLGKDEQLTGRLPLWAAALVSFAKRPLLGYGYQAFWTGMHGEALNVFTGTRFEIYQAQNGLLEVALELGAVGVILVLATLYQAVRDALTCFQVRQSDAVNWYAGILVLSIAYNMDEAFLAFSHSLPWLLYIVACAGLSREASLVRQSRHASASLQRLKLSPLADAPPLLEGSVA